jgi:tyrosyl-tRNA synthetase
VKKFFNYFTEIDLNEVENIFKKEKNINNLKILLANETTKILHGKEASKKAEQTAKETFEGGGLGSGLPIIEIKSNEIKKGINILDFVANNKILPSKSEARRVIANKGLKIDDILVIDEKKLIQVKDFKKNILKLSYGKKKHFLIKII